VSVRLDHIGIAVKDLDAALGVFRDLFGLSFKGIEEVPEQRVKVAFLPVGDTKLELLAATGPQGPVAKFIERRGEGVHHIALHVEDLEKTMAQLKEQGIRFIDEEPRQGAGGARIAFVHPKSTYGVLVELCER